MFKPRTTIYHLFCDFLTLGDKVFHRIVRKKLLELTIQLRRKHLVVCNDEHWFIQNDVLHHPNANDIFAVKSLPKFTSIPEGDSGGKSFKRLHRWRYSPTAAYGNNEVHLHPYLPRRISVAEALAIQSLPSDFSLPSDLPLSAKFKMVGNGVPYLLAFGIAKDISEWIEQFLHRIEE